MSSQASGGMRRLRRATLVGLMFAANFNAGCSLLTVAIPRSFDTPAEKHPRCRYRYAPFLFDATIGPTLTAFSIQTAMAASRPIHCAANEGDFGPCPTDGWDSLGEAIFGTALTMALLYEASAVYGGYEVVDCERELRRHPAAQPGAFQTP